MCFCKQLSVPVDQLHLPINLFFSDANVFGLLQIGLPLLMTYFSLPTPLFLQATTEYSAERQLNDLLFPRIQSRLPKKKPTHQNDH